MADGDNLLNAFHHFAKQTLETLRESLKASPNFPIDTAVRDEWVMQMEDRIRTRSNNKLDDQRTTNALLDWLARFQKKFAYISRQRFYEELRACAEWACNLVAEADTPYDMVILTTESETFKAGVWLTLLMWYKLRRVVTHVMRQSDVNDLLNDESFAGQYILVIQLDDASFSGTQYNAELAKLYKGTHTRVTHACAIVFVSEQAKQSIMFRVQKCPNVTLLFKPDAPSIETLYDEGEELPAFTTSQMWQLFFNTGEVCDNSMQNLSATYFFHKMADNLSVFQQIIAFAPLPPTEDPSMYDNDPLLGIEIGRKGMISGCDFEDARNKAKTAEMLNTDLSRLYPCPKPPYKSVILTFKPPVKDDEDDEDVDAIIISRKTRYNHSLLHYLHEVTRTECSVCASIAAFVCGKCDARPYCSIECQDAEWIKGKHRC